MRRPRKWLILLIKKEKTIDNNNDNERGSIMTFLKFNLSHVEMSYRVYIVIRVRVLVI